MQVHAEPSITEDETALMIGQCLLTMYVVHVMPGIPSCLQLPHRDDVAWVYPILLVGDAARGALLWTMPGSFQDSCQMGAAVQRWWQPCSWQASPATPTKVRLILPQRAGHAS